MDYLFSTKVQFLDALDCDPDGWLAVGDNIYLFQVDSNYKLKMYQLNSKTLKWSQFVAIKDGRPYLFDHYITNKHRNTFLAYNEYIIIYSANYGYDNMTDHLCMINVNTPELKEWAIHGGECWYYDEWAKCIVDHYLYAFSRYKPLIEFSTLDLNVENSQWAPTTKVKATLDQFSSSHGPLALLTYGTDIYLLVGLSASKGGYDDDGTMPIENIKLYKFETLTHQVSQVGEEFEVDMVVHFNPLDAQFVNGDELCFIQGNLDYERYWIHIFNIPSKQWRKISIIFMSTTHVCWVNSQMFTFSFSDYNMPYDFKFGIIDLSPSLKGLCEVAILKHRLDTSELPKVLRDRLKHYQNICDVKF